MDRFSQILLCKAAESARDFSLSAAAISGAPPPSPHIRLAGRAAVSLGSVTCPARQPAAPPVIRLRFILGLKKSQARSGCRPITEAVQHICSTSAAPAISARDGAAVPHPQAVRHFHISARLRRTSSSAQLPDGGIKSPGQGKDISTSAV